MGDLKGAKARFERALEIGKKTLGEEHPDVAAWTNNLGSVLQDMGDMEGAKACYERALRICIKFFGEDHPKTITTRENLEALDDAG